MQRIARRRYTDDFETQAITLAESLGRSKAPRQPDMSVRTLDNWLDASRAGSLLRMPDRNPASEVKWSVA